MTAEYRDRQASNRSSHDPRRQYNVQTICDPREFTFNRIHHRYGDAATEDHAVVVNMGVPADDNVDFYAFGTWGRRKRFDFRVIKSVNASLGVASPTEFDSRGSARQPVHGEPRPQPLVRLAGVTLASGLEYRRETFTVRAGELASSVAGPVRVGENNPQFTGAAGQAFAARGAQVFPGFQPRIGGEDVTGRNARENFSACLEVDADVIERWTVQLAGRYENTRTSAPT